MGVENLVEKILRDAKSEADAILSEARSQAQAIVLEAEEEGKTCYEEIVAEAKRKAEEEKKRRITLASLESRNAILMEKATLTDEVFSRAVENIIALPKDKYLELLVKTLVSCAPEGDSEVILCERDKEIGNELVERANTELSSTSKAKVRLSEETRPILGGFILRGPGVEINNSLEAQVNQVREKVEPLVIEKLFGE